MKIKAIGPKLKFFANIAINVLTSVVTVLLIIPGEQGESILQMAIEALKALIAGG